MHCVKCHGPRMRRGGLRLDDLAFAESGGDSGKPVLHGTLETNEIYQRVSSTDRTVRMPKNAEALSADEIGRIKRWVEEGTPWPGPEIACRAPEKPFYARWWDSISDLNQQFHYEYEFIKPFAVAFVIAQIALLFLARAKAAYNAHRPWTTGRLSRFCRFASAVTSRELGMIWLLLLAAGTLTVTLGHEQRLENDLARSRIVRENVESPWIRTIYGYPPMPVRPDHPKQLVGTYYRGNCERDPKLFNNGNYLTATFRIQLCDAEHLSVHVGDQPDPKQLFLRVEIERGPGTSDSLFSKELMAAVYLSEKFQQTFSDEPKDQPVRLKTLDLAKRWVAFVPLRAPDNIGRVTGLVYLYTGRIDNHKIQGDPDYAIRYEVDFEDGKVTADSELWMNSFGNGVFALPEPPGKLPYREWFDYRPIPPITGENSNDPKLLGVDEYVKKGLIPPPIPSDRAKAAPAGDSQPGDDKE